MGPWKQSIESGKSRRYKETEQESICKMLLEMKVVRGRDTLTNKDTTYELKAKNTLSYGINKEEI